MMTAKRAVALATLSAWAALALPAAGQSRSGGSSLDMRLRAWEKQLVLPQRISARSSWAERRLRPSGLRKLKTMARALAPATAAGTDFDTLRNKAAHDVTGAFSGLAATDVTEAAFLVMIMATKDMDDDIRTIMVEIKAMTAAKQKMRDMIRDLNGWISREMSKQGGSKDIDNKKAAGSKTKAPPLRRMTFETKTSPIIHLEYVKAPVITPLPPRNPGLTLSGLTSLRDDIQGNLDSLNEMSEMTSLRLQMTMERRAKIIQTLSNIMKKISSTQESLVQNIK